MSSEEDLAKLALERVKSAREGKLGDFIKNLDVDSQVYTFWLSLLALREAGSIRLLDELISRELDLALKMLGMEDERDLLRIAEILDLRVLKVNYRVAVYASREGSIHYKVFNYAVPVRDYIRVVSRSRDEGLKLVNSPVKEGLVYIDSETLRLLIKESARVRIQEMIKNLEAPDTEAFRDLVEKLRELESIVASSLDESSLPACIKDIVGKAKRGVVSDFEIYTLISFLKHVDAPEEVTYRILADAKLSDEATAKIIARALDDARIPGPPTCSELKRRGVCDCSSDLTREYRESRSRGLER